jgi:hypothetical protein
MEIVLITGAGGNHAITDSSLQHICNIVIMEHINK